MTPCGCASGCGCAGRPGLRPVTNPAGLRRISYRTGDFDSFRRALLGHLDGEAELDIWRPSAGSDLGLQVLDWWAYIADVLTFYNELVANEDYLGTATQDPSVRRLVDLLGYRPRPGIGASAQLAAIAASGGPLSIRAGLAVASKAAPGLASQTFETVTATSFAHPSSAPAGGPDDLAAVPPTDGPPSGSPPGAAVPPGHPQLIAHGGVLVRGVPTSVAAGDRLLLLARSWRKPGDPAAVVSVTGLVTEKDPYGRKNTRVLLTGTAGLEKAAAKNFRLLRSTRSAHLSGLPAGAAVITDHQMVLDGTARYLRAGDPLLLDLTTSATTTIAGLTGYAETRWYANAAADTPTKVPPDTTGQPLLLAALTVTGTDLSQHASSAGQIIVRAGWVEIGVLLETPALTLDALPTTLTLARPPSPPAGTVTPALLEDADGNGEPVTVTADGSSVVSVAAADPDQAAGPLVTPLRLLGDLITVTRGASVRQELLGAGDATQAGQDFALAKSPVTYLSDAPGRSGDGYSSTIRLAVDGRCWSEVRTLYGRRPGETVFVTYEDDDQKTHVRFGDGQAGARLPSGAPVLVDYRVGSGAAVPAAGALTQILTPLPNLGQVRNPVPPVGGSDPDPADQLRRLAPRSVLTLGRAVSGDDYAAVAASAPGVTRAAADWAWDPVEQRPTVRVHVGDDAGAVASARAALRAQADPNRSLIVVPAISCPTILRVTLELDPGFVAGGVEAAVRAALLDPPGGLFAPGVLDLGQALYRSRIESVVSAVPGVTATRNLWIRWQRPDGLQTSTGTRFSPGEGGFLDLTPAGLRLGGEETPDE